MLGTYWIPLSSCTRVHPSCSDENIFHLLPTDFSIWARNWKQVYLMGKIFKNQSCTLWIIWFLGFHKILTHHQNLLQHKSWLIYNVKASCIVSLVIWQEAMSFWIAQSTFYSQITKVTLILEAFSILHVQVYIMIILNCFKFCDVSITEMLILGFSYLHCSFCYC